MTKTQRYGRAYRVKLKQDVFEHYSKGTPKCAHCGLTNILILTLDHINSDGAEQRKKLLGTKCNGGHLYYAKLRSSGYKEKDLQVLCHNCHHLLEAERTAARLALYSTVESEKLPTHVIKYPIVDMLTRKVKTTEIQKVICAEYKCSSRTARRWIYAIKGQIKEIT